MIKGKVAYIILGIIVVTAIILRVVQFFDKKDNTGQIINSSTSKELVVSKEVIVEETEQKFILEGEKATSTAEISGVNNKLALITEPQPNSIISSPLIVKGEAPGPWFFEASFPVKLIDNSGNIIVTEPATAQSDPLTENFVPYETLLEFNTTATSGYLILTNDNPSGLPENELSVKIPVLFLNK